MTPLTASQQKLVADNIGLARRFAADYPILGLSWEEMLSIYGEGLVRAARKFNAVKSRFSTYAYRCMLSQRCKYFQELAWMKNGGGRIKTVVMSQLGKEGKSYDHAAASDDSVETADVRANLLEAVESLGQRAAYVLKRRFFDEVTLEAIGAELKLSKERIRQIQTKALAALRQKLGPQFEEMRCCDRKRRRLHLGRRRKRKTNQYATMACS